MKEKKLAYYKLILISLILSLIVALAIMNNHDKEILTVGIFYGSNWDVPGTSYEKILDAAEKKLKEKYPNVKIKYEEGITQEDYPEWLSEKILQGDEPDVFFVMEDDFYKYASLGALKNLDSQIEADQNFKKSDFYEPALETGSIDGVQYAIPFECNTTLMFVNKTLLSKSGYKIPDDDWDWDTFYELSKKLTKDTNGNGHNDQFGTYSYSIYDAIASNNTQFFLNHGKKSNLLDDKVSESLEFVNKLSSLNQSENVTSETFDLGHVAFCPMTLAEYLTYMPYPWRIKKYSSFEWTCIPMPAGPSGDNIATIDSLLIGMGKKTSNPDLAWELIRTLTSDEEIQSLIYQYTSGASPLKTVTKSKDTLALLNQETPGTSDIDMSLLDEALENAVTTDKFKNYTKIMEKLDYEIMKYMESEDDSSVKLYNMNEKIQTYLDQ